MIIIFTVALPLAILASAISTSAAPVVKDKVTLSLGTSC